MEVKFQIYLCLFHFVFLSLFFLFIYFLYLNISVKFRFTLHFCIKHVRLLDFNFCLFQCSCFLSQGLGRVCVCSKYAYTYHQAVHACPMYVHTYSYLETLICVLLFLFLFLFYLYNMPLFGLLFTSVSLCFSTLFVLTCLSLYFQLGL